MRSNEQLQNKILHSGIVRVGCELIDVTWSGLKRMMSEQKIGRIDDDCSRSVSLKYIYNKERIRRRHMLTLSFS
jgi:hypothetical protein